MCLIFLSLKNHPSYKLIVAANRDEFYNRKTASADYWEDQPQILGGRDLEASGTWLGMTRSGKISMITNYRDPKNINPNAPSRGQLVSNYLAGSLSGEDFLKAIDPVAKNYNGFNLIVGAAEELFYFSNYRAGYLKLTQGIYGLSNHLLETPWPKVQKGKMKFAELLGSAKIKTEDIFSLLYDEEVAADIHLPDTGIGLERERALSSMFIKTSGYGTRSSTVILVDYSNRVLFSERVYDLTSFTYTTKEFTFDINQ